METTGDLVCIVIELSSCMELCQYDLKRALAFFRMDIYRNTSAIILDCAYLSIRTIFEIFYLIRAEISMVGMTQMTSSYVDIESLAFRVIFFCTEMPFADMVCSVTVILKAFCDIVLFMGKMFYIRCINEIALYRMTFSACINPVRNTHCCRIFSRKDAGPGRGTHWT